MWFIKILPIIIPLFIVAISCFVGVYYLDKAIKKHKTEESEKEERRKNYSLLPGKMMQQYSANASYMCQTVAPMISIPFGVFCYLLALDDALMIITDTQPQTTYRLAYEKIVRFQSGEEKSLERATFGMFRVATEEERIKIHIHIEYMAQDSLQQLSLISGLTNEDKWFNEAAMSHYSIFSYVNEHIQSQEINITL